MFSVTCGQQMRQHETKLENEKRVFYLFKTINGKLANDMLILFVFGILLSGIFWYAKREKIQTEQKWKMLTKCVPFH